MGRTRWDIFVNNKNDMGSFTDSIRDAKVSIDPFHCNNIQDLDDICDMDKLNKSRVN